MNKSDNELLKITGLDEDFYLPQIDPCNGCSDRTIPCQVDREIYPSTWWLHKSINLRLRLAHLIHEKIL